MNKGYICQCCGEKTDGIPMGYGTDLPIYVYPMSKRDRQKRVKTDGELCVIDDEHFFMRANICLPVLDSGEDFMWGVWTTISAENFSVALENWETEGREGIVKPAFGYLSTPLPVYPDTINLNVLIHTLPVGNRPILEIKPSSHPLSVEQREGITMARVHEIAKTLSK